MLHKIVVCKNHPHPLIPFLSRFGALFCILISLLLLLPVREYASNATVPSLSLEDRILRLHILAAGNDTSSQEIKLHVRDAVLTHVQDAVAGADTAQEAEDALAPLLPEIVAVANRILEESGVSYRASVELTTEYFPIKQYGSLLLPPGEYRALRIVLDEGDGKNWWCMLYPSLCFTEGITATLPEEEKEELRGLLSEEEFDTLFSGKEKKPVFRFKLVELWKKLWGRR
ncbi:MAG: stage II sporulation protein R [Lachnospiraceae bacterium]|nr:stage II sporulation protein R [Lachnospiraceae bacterium]